jgi:spore germination protein YaaH
MPLSVFAFYNGLTEQTRGYYYLQRYGRIINELALFQITIQKNGTLLGRLSRRIIDEAHAMGAKVYLTVSNLSAQGKFSTELMARLVSDQTFADLVGQNIRNILIQYRCDGVNLDLERAAPKDRALFTRLIRTWTALLKKENFIVTIDVPAKNADDPNDIWKGSFDYKAIGETVDEVIIMTYEEHWPASPPGSVASIPWVNEILNYALAIIPKQKIYMGIPLYGYDWSERGGAKAISYPTALELARRYGAPIQWDERQTSSYFIYETRGIRHTVYFEDLRSLTEKLDLASGKGIKGVALWEMNLSYPSFWEALQSNLLR